LHCGKSVPASALAPFSCITNGGDGPMTNWSANPFEYTITSPSPRCLCQFSFSSFTKALYGSFFLLQFFLVRACLCGYRSIAYTFGKCWPKMDWWTQRITRQNNKFSKENQTGWSHFVQQHTTMTDNNAIVAPTPSCRH
jgi:hypothetical protein